MTQLTELLLPFASEDLPSEWVPKEKKKHQGTVSHSTRTSPFSRIFSSTLWRFCGELPINEWGS